MLITADQLLAHAIGDYILQSQWMAENKTKRFLPAAVHALTYSLLFLVFRPTLAAFAVILGTHFFIDRYRLARYVVWAKNWLGPKHIYAAEDGWTSKRCNPPFSECKNTGYPPSVPPFMAVWLLIAGDNILHVLINGLALRYL